MAWIDDIDILNDAATPADWSITSYFDQPTLNDSAATTPIYVEGSACMWWPLKKGGTNGYIGTATITGTPTLTGRILVGFINYPFADIDAIPISAIAMRLSSAVGFTTNYLQWDARAQVLSPENVPISGHTPIIGYEDAGTETGTFGGSAESVGWVATTGNTADGKQGGFDWFFLVSWLGAHSVTLTETFFSGLYDEYFDNEGSGLPGQTSRPIGVFSQAGDFFQSNVRFQLGDGTADTANIVVTETGKTVFFNNLHVNHELGYLFVNPASTHEIRLTLTDCVHLWNDQASGNEIFDGIANVDYFQITGCSFSRGGAVSLPADTVNRWVRATKFNDCQAVTISDGEFTDNIVSSGEAITVSGDADLTGTSVLTPVVAADASGLIWNGNFDPDGNLDGMTFSKGTNAHHAIAFGTAAPLNITLRNIDFSGFNATDGLNDSTIHVLRTSGTVTINVIGGSGNVSYKSAGAVVNIVSNPVQAVVTILDGRDNTALQNALVVLEASDGTGDLPFEDVVTITRSGATASVSHTSHGMSSGDKVVIRDAVEPQYNGVYVISNVTTNAYDYTVAGTPATPATGTILATGVVLEGLTDVNGQISDTRTWSTAQPVTGLAQKGKVSPVFQPAGLIGTISTTTGLLITQPLAGD